ncbi:MAG: hypothetical protein ACK5XN_15815, partial [Bacteroidota bacterium]
ENVTVSSGNGTTWNSNSYAIAFSNSSAGFAPAGNMVLNNVTVTGHVAKGALSFQYYNDVNNISLNNVDLRNVSAPWGDLIVHHSDSDAFNAGNTQLKTLNIWLTGGVNAENVVFTKADGTVLDRTVTADAYTIANQIGDGVDATGAGLVRYVSDKVYVTTTSFIAPFTLEGALERAVATSRAGDTIVVQDGVPTLLTQVITKNITFSGGFAFNAGNIPTGETASAVVTSFMERRGSSTVVANVVGMTRTQIAAIGANRAGFALVNLPPVTVVENGDPVGYYATIQGAIDATTTVNGAIIQIAAGTYAENITINKSIELRGPNYGMNPNTGTRAAEAIVVPASTNNDTASSGSNIITIAASNVVIDGVTIDGDNPNLADST